MDYTLFYLACVAFILIVFIEGHIREKRNRRSYRALLKESYGKQNMTELSSDETENISLYHRRYAENNPGVFTIDDITWNDLSMDVIYNRMDNCSCILGEEELYHRLRTPILAKDDKAYGHFCELREYYDSHEDERVRTQEILHEIGINHKTSITRIFDYALSLEDESNLQHYLIIAAVLFSVFMLFKVPAVGIILLIAALIVAIGTYIKNKKTIEPVISTFNYAARMLRASSALDKLDCEVLAQDKAELLKCRKALGGISSKSMWITTGAATMDNPAALFLEYVKMFLHIDLIMINKLIRQLKENIDNIDLMRSILGTIDASIAAASYMNSLGCRCIPEFEEGDIHYSAKDLLHPLVRKPVTNSIDTKGPILLTGSNASGKSTFLKIVAISALMAQTLGFVPANEYRSSIFMIFTSMALADNIRGGESYFVVEIKSIKRILDSGNDSIPVLCCIDEVLRGTNTVERIAASTHILKTLSGAHCIPFAATHDIELTQLLEGIYANYHFDEEITEDDVKFNYLLKPGRAESRNAIKLLAVMDYDKTLIEDAERMASDFMSTGEWGVKSK